MKKLLFLMLLIVLVSCKKEEEQSQVEYPEYGYYGKNILYSNDSVFNKCDTVSIAANVSSNKLSICISLITYNEPLDPRNPLPVPYDIDWLSAINYTIEYYNSKQRFTSNLNGYADCAIRFNRGIFKVDYFINYNFIKSKRIVII